MASDDSGLGFPAFQGDVATPQYDGAAVDQFMMDLLSLGTPTAPAVASAFNNYLENGDAVCPGATDELVEVGPEGCTNDAGYFYSGIGWYRVVEEVFDDAEAWRLSFGGDFRVGSPDGEVMTGGGELNYGLLTRGDSQELNIAFEGSFVDSAGPDWLRQGYSTLSSYIGTNDHGAITTVFTGGVSIGTTWTLQLDDVITSTETACPWEPQGTIAIRDDVGYWYSWEHEADCDPCGPVTFAATGESLGEACLDLRPFFADLWSQSVAPR